MKNLLKLSPLFLFAVVALSSCGPKERSATTGWAYNDQEWGGFEKLDYQGQATGPNLVLIEGGTFTMGLTEQDVTYEWNNVPRRVTVSSFYMDETEVTNSAYKEYLHWLKRVFSENYPDVWKNAHPDTLVWREELSFNEPFVETYFRHPSYDDYPVVGVTWLQSSEYCKWRTDRTNEMILIEKGILNKNPEQRDSDNFNTEAYLLGQYQGSVRKNLEDKSTGGERPVRFEDGILLPSYRLPTEAEWEYAALALVGKMESELHENITDRRLYPWDGNTVRYQRRDKSQGMILANFKKGRGDYMGMAGRLNDRAHITAPVRTSMPNDFGLFHMAGNVSEWVADIYRPMTSLALSDVESQDLNPYRGNRFQTKVMEDGEIVEKDSLGRIQYRDVTDEEAVVRENYRKGKVHDYLDGDEQSNSVYEYGVTTLISNKSRVIKGGSWADRAYWLSPGARRFKEEDKSDRTIGFRCAMTRTGSPDVKSEEGGNNFGVKRSKVNRRYK